IFALLLFGTAARADPPLRYRCDTVMTYGPGPCRGAVAPAQDQTTLEIDLQRGAWSSGSLGGAVDGKGSVLTLRQWGARSGRDATLDRASGAFEYRFQSGCLVQHQAGTCTLTP